MASLIEGRRIVAKIGSALLVDADTGALRTDWLRGLAADVAWLRGLGKDVILVSSGSIALGRGLLGLGGARTVARAIAGGRGSGPDPPGPRL